MLMAKRDFGCLGVLWATMFALLAGCGTTKARTATEQLLVSDAVDRTVAQIDFRPLAGAKVYFDTKYIKPDRPMTVASSNSADYLISALRQQMMAAGCLLQDKQEEADFIVEGRVGALGSDDHEVTYGIPQNSGITEAASLVPTAPRIPAIPALSLARKEDLKGAAKIAVFAYHRQTREPVWQSGVAISSSHAKQTWLFGVGPFQYGTIYDGTRLAGNRIQLPFVGEPDGGAAPSGLVPYYEQVDFEELAKSQKANSPESLDAEFKALAEGPKLFPLTERLLGLPRPDYPRGFWTPAHLPPVELDSAVPSDPAAPQAVVAERPAPSEGTSTPPAAVPAPKPESTTAPATPPPAAPAPKPDTSPPEAKPEGNPPAPAKAETPPSSGVPAAPAAPNPAPAPTNNGTAVR
jgi:hypothetical protein